MPRPTKPARMGSPAPITPTSNAPTNIAADVVPRTATPPPTASTPPSTTTATNKNTPNYPSRLMEKHPLFRNSSLKAGLGGSDSSLSTPKRAYSLSDSDSSHTSTPTIPSETAKHSRAFTDPVIAPQKSELQLQAIAINSDSETNSTSEKRTLPPVHSLNSSASQSASNSSAAARSSGSQQTQQQAPTSAYACPICGQVTKNLLHLNHHLDNVHSINSFSPNSSDDDDPGKQILDWFKKTGESASRVLKETGQNLGLKKGVSMDVLNQIAITTDTIATTSSAAVMAPKDGSNFDLNPNTNTQPPNPEEDASLLYTADGSVTAAAAAAGFVTRKHWQKDKDTMKCNNPTCSKALVPSGVKMGKMVVGASGVGVIRVHCRKCGQVYCEEHVSFQMKLRAHDAKHDAASGFWCRVCETCFVSKEGYFDTNGVTHTRTATFLKFRSSMSDVVALEVNKLESRYEKLAALYQDIPSKPTGKQKTLSRLTSFSSGGSSTRDIDQRVVAWQEDTEVSSCPLCDSSFSTIFNPLNRRHHCRLCGRVVCGLETCISNIPLIPRETLFQSQSMSSPITPEQVTIPPPKPAEVKVCTDCKKLVFRRKNAVLEQLNKPEVVVLYETFLQLKQHVEELLPKFNNLIMALSLQNTIRMEDKEYILASKHRKTLMDYFADMEKLGKRIKAIPGASHQHQKVQDNIQIMIIQFLQSHMFTLTLMPKVTPAPGSKGNGGGGDKFQVVSFADMQRLDQASKTLEVMEAQEATLRSQLEDAVKKRRLEDAGALREALEDVEVEVARLKEEVEALKGTAT
ncbi:UNVERIFIED_CONTAM: carboxypeptidase Y-deficient [Siphonaria sp. JEL0065]|nr:carboxypeptidase Y-deficient [Siphonaria sp. JEL0065]